MTPNKPLRMSSALLREPERARQSVKQRIISLIDDQQLQSANVKKEHFSPLVEGKTFFASKSEPA